MREGRLRTSPPARTALIAVLLAAVTSGVYAPVAGFDYVSYDDRDYVLLDPLVTAGITGPGIRRALTEPHNANWHPLTTLSFMLDVELFGLDPGASHRINVGLHVLSVLLLFAFLLSSTGSRGRSALVAALFALHPLHVESVAWISQRKDVLSTAFGFGALWAYAVYVRRPGALRFLTVLGLYALGLSAKPMLVTWPFVMLLLDVWPLGRFRRETTRRRDVRRALLEKLPLLVLALVVSGLTLWAHATAGAMESSQLRSHHLVNALLSYATYLRQAVWPVDLAVLHPYPTHFSGTTEAAASALLAALTLLCLRLRDGHPYLLVGWLWYLGTLLPVIGLVPVGAHAHADRYAYVPLVGIYFATVWGVADAVERHGPALRLATACMALAALAGLGAVTVRQVAVWENSESLYRHTLEVAPDNPVIWNNLGVVLAEQGRYPEAVEAFRSGLGVPSGLELQLHKGAADALIRAGRPGEAVHELDRALAQDPTAWSALFLRGRALKEQGDLDAARRDLERVLEAVPDDPEVHDELGRVLNRLGRPGEAAAHLLRARQLGLAPTRP